ncbi:unnamed protein product [Thlaspi arvense]|uniref:Fe2OG dioxygenase domain-containing protein n=1 Tax=Thlaspi arvense TaxID=13288 RepID=A0AAU9R8W1_THLAR|nr:unnamed protein product [Thlaspi arvense]
MTVVGDGTVGGGDTPPANTAAETAITDLRLMLNADYDRMPDNYDDLPLEFSPCILSSMEKYLPLNSLNRDEKAKFMSGIILKYLPSEERSRDKMDRDYKQTIKSNYQPLHKELYTLDPEIFFVPSFLEAIKGNTGLRSIISEPSPGVLVFDMLQPSFCEKMISEVKNFRKWAKQTKLRIKKANCMKFFSDDVTEATLDSHHGFVVEHGKDRDADIGFHVDDSEVTLNVCLGKEFVGGELYFRGTRCEKHVNIDATSEERYDYSHKPGQAVIHRGRHRHGARATTSGQRVNMILWCRSSIFREMKTYKKEFPKWCGKCHGDKKEKKSQTLAARRKELVRIESESEA